MVFTTLLWSQMDMGGHVAEHHRPHRKSAVPPLFGHTGRVDIIGDHRARAMRRRGLTFRQIARERGVSLTRVGASQREASAGRMRREIRAEIRRAGGVKAWWNA
jgi:hypothetical protein